MSDVERELRMMFVRREHDTTDPPRTPPGLIRRTRTRQALIVTTSIATVVVVAVASLALIRAVSDREDGIRPADSRVVLPDPPPGFSSAALPYASIAYPEDWSLLDTSPLLPMGVAPPYVVPSGPVLQLANFDPDLPHSPRCMVEPDSLPDGGVLLTVGVMTPEEAELGNPPSGPWPVELQPLPSNHDPVCVSGPRPRTAVWTAPNGLIYWANAAEGPDASQADVRAMERAFASLALPTGREPQMSQMAAFQGQGTPRVVLGTERIGSNVATLVAYVELNTALWIGVSGDEGGSCCLGGAFAPHSGSTREPISSTIAITPNGTLVYGVIAPEVAAAELVTSNGDALPVAMVDLPPSMGYQDRVVWGIAPGADERATIVGYDADGNAIGNPILPAGPRVTIATGEDPEGGPWELYLEPTNDGTGLGFGFGTGGGGSGCCLKPLGGDFRLDGWSTGGGPSDITALASGAVTRVVFEAASGVEIEGGVYPVPDATLDIPQVALVIVPSELPLEGDLVAFDDDGNELGRELITEDQGEPPGPTPEIDAVWTLLRNARDAIGRWEAEHGHSLEGFSLEMARSAFPEIAWNASGVGKTVPGEVSIRGFAPAGGDELTGWLGWTLALVGATPNFQTYCIAVNIDENGGGNFRYGIQDAGDYPGCRGGWPELG
jgi:hypothetical protein